MKFTRSWLAVVMFFVVLAPFAMGGDCDCPTKPTQTVISVCVDHTRTLDQLVDEGGYYSVSPEINKFEFSPGAGVVKTDIILLRYDRSMLTKQVLADMESRSLRSATAQELLSLGAKRKELPEKGTAIVALGTVQHWGSGRYVAVLWGRADGRYLYLHWDEDPWSLYVRFAAVRK